MGKVQELKNFSVKKIELILAVIFISNRAQLKKKVYLGRLENKSRRKLEPKTVEVKEIKGWKQQRQKNLRATQPIKLGSPHPPPSRPLLSFFSLGAFFVFFGHVDILTSIRFKKLKNGGLFDACAFRGNPRNSST